MNAATYFPRKRKNLQLKVISQNQLRFLKTLRYHYIESVTNKSILQYMMLQLAGGRVGCWWYGFCGKQHKFHSSFNISMSISVSFVKIFGIFCCFFRRRKSSSIFIMFLSEKLLVKSWFLTKKQQENKFVKIKKKYFKN